MLPYSVEGTSGCAACLWQVVNGFNGVTDESGSERRSPRMADITLSDASRAHTYAHMPS